MGVLTGFPLYLFAEKAKRMPFQSLTHRANPKKEVIKTNKYIINFNGFFNQKTKFASTTKQQ